MGVFVCCMGLAFGYKTKLFFKEQKNTHEYFILIPLNLHS